MTCVNSLKNKAFRSGRYLRNEECPTLVGRYLDRSAHQLADDRPGASDIGPECRLKLRDHPSIAIRNAHREHAHRTP